MTKAGLTLMECLSEIEDPRGPSNGTRHDVTEMLVIAVCAMLSNVESFEDIALWGRVKQAWLRRFLPLKHDIPSNDTFNRLFRILEGRRTAEGWSREAGCGNATQNRLYWMLDVNFAEDVATVHKDNAPQNLSLLRKIVLNLARADTSDDFKGGPGKKRKRASWDDDIRMNMLGLKSI